MVEIGLETAAHADEIPPTESSGNSVFLSQASIDVPLADLDPLHSDQDRTKSDNEGDQNKDAELENDAAQNQDNQLKPAEPSEQDLNPPLAAFMAACQAGDLETVQIAIESQSIAAHDTFSDGITGLHWAAINNRLSVVKFLVENKICPADPNILGGTLKASPLHWACRNGLVYVVDYMLSHTDADVALTDSQHYNALHLAVHSLNITLVVYLVLNCVLGSGKLYIDEPDDIQCTALHWAAYQGDILTVNALIKYGADVNKVDKNLMTPLHWAFIRGYKSVMAALVDAQLDIFAQNDKGKDLFAVCKDMNCENTWLTVLREADRDPGLNWQPRRHVVSAKVAKLVTFFAPYVVLPLALDICSFSAGLAIPKLLLAAVAVAVTGFALQRYVVPVYMLKDKPMFKTPLMAGVFSATAFWAVAAWVFAMVPYTWWLKFLTNLLLLACIVIFTFTFFKAMFINPGFVPEPSDYTQVQEQVQDLIRLGQFDTEHFCVNSFVRKPLRLKYSKFNKRLVARFDHFCPWVYNDVGVRNHKLFMAFVYALTVAIVLFVSVSLKFFEEKAEKLGYESDFEDKCYLLSEELCVGFYNNHFIFNLVAWSSFQFVWLFFLFVVQTFQILKGLTSWEFMNLNDRASNPSYTHSTVPGDLAVLQPVHRHHQHGLGTILTLLGIDQFLMAMKAAALSLFLRGAHTQSYSSIDRFQIPTDFGWKQNWLDFWFIGDIEWRNLLFLPIEGENNLNGQVVDYYKLYEYPPRVSGPTAV